MEIFNTFFTEVIATLITFVIVFILRLINAKLIRRFARVSETLEHRTRLIIKFINILIGIIAIVFLLVIWGVKPQNLVLVLSSVFAVIGVAMFAQWSILSNITSGIILFFAAPFKIGDTIRIHDKDFPIEAEVEDIKGFYIYLKTKDGDFLTYPNSLLLQKGISVIKKPYEEQHFED